MNNHKRAKNLQIWVIVPAFNEQGTITNVIKNVLRVTSHILVVDDGSTDQTSIRLAKLPVVVIRNPKNLGYVKSLEKGLHYAFAHHADYAITYDADGQHLSIDLRQFLSLIEKTHPDIIFGNRSFKNRLAENIFSYYSKRYLRISDPFCGFKAYKKSFFAKIGNKLENHYSVGTENAIHYINTQKASVYEINLTTVKRKDESRFAGRIYGNLLEFYSALNLIWYVRASR